MFACTTMCVLFIGREGQLEAYPTHKSIMPTFFLVLSGVPYLKRKIATSTVVVHTIEHEGDVLKLEVGLGWLGLG